jgi:hypothetical protein
LINPTTPKISIGKANKIQRRRSRIPNPKLRSVFEIPENSLNYRSMWRAWGSLKVRAQPHDKLNVRRVAVRYRREAIMLMYSLWSTALPSSSRSSEIVELIRVDTGLSSAMLNFFIRSFVYLAWCTKVHCFVCFTRIHKKKVNSPIMDIWNSLLHHFLKSGHKSVRRANKDNIIHINLNK